MNTFNTFSKIYVAFVSTLIIFLLTGCDVKVGVLGYPQEIIIVADSSLWNEVGPEVTEVFEAPVYTPMPEPSFSVNWIPLEELSAYKDRMNVFLIGVAGERNSTSEYMDDVLPFEFKNGVEGGQYFYLYNDNLYASGQISLIIYGKDRNTFKEKFSQFSEDIYNEFSSRYFKRLSKDMFKTGEQKDLEEILLKKYGWKLRIQHDYFFAMQDINEKYVWLRRMDPDRWISIWEMDGDVSDLTLESLITIRNDVLGKHYEGDSVSREDTYLTNVEFSGRSATKIVGVWQNDSLFVGGPFRTYAFFDSVKTKIYCVDIAVMAPNKQKKPYLDQLEAIANTFEVAEEEK